MHNQSNTPNTQLWICEFTLRRKDRRVISANPFSDYCSLNGHTYLNEPAYIV